MKKWFSMSKKWIYTFVAVILILSIGSGLWYRHWYYSRYGHSKDDACVKKTAKDYTADAQKFENDLLERNLPFKKAKRPQRNSEIPPPSAIKIPPILIPIVLIENLLRSLECTAMPMPVKNDNTIGEYPNPSMQKPLPPPCEDKPIIYNPGLLPKKEAIQKLVTNIGRIEIRNQVSDEKTVPPVMLGTGFLIAPGTFAVSCHVIAPVLKVHPDLNLDYPEKLVVDFETTRYSLDHTKEIDVTGFLGCSKKNGLDVALIDICPRIDPTKPKAKCDMPSASEPQYSLQLLWGGPKNIDEIKTEFSIVVGYPDFNHFIDPVKRAIYAPWANNYKDVSINKADTYKDASAKKYDYYNYGKFLLIDGVEDEDDCDDDLGIVLDTVSTTVGESGSVVIDLHELTFKKGTPRDKNGWKDVDPRKPVVVGMHTCCSAYSEKDYGKPPEFDLPCARLHRTFHNQDISSWSILKDHTLCPLLQDRGVHVVDMKDQPVDLACHWWW
jgi:hypothetical protein